MDSDSNSTIFLLVKENMGSLIKFLNLKLMKLNSNISVAKRKSKILRKNVQFQKIKSRMNLFKIHKTYTMILIKS